MLFTKPVLQNMLDSALAAIEQNVEMLNRLDSATGDGDHGTAILAAMKAAACAAKKDDPAAPTLFPDFSKEEFKHALEEYSKRNRRYGAVPTDVTDDRKD